MDDLIANGERITQGGIPAARERKAGMVPMMGPSVYAMTPAGRAEPVNGTPRMVPSG